MTLAPLFSQVPAPTRRAALSYPRGWRALFVSALLLLAFWTVYTRYVDLHAIDLVTNKTFRDQSLEFHRSTLAGTRAFPYQWRVLGSWLVWAGERTTPIDPHVIDAAIKTIALALSAGWLFLFAGTMVDTMGALLVTAVYFLVTAAAFASEGYAIYFSNDFLMMTGWCAVVWGASQRKWALVVAATFLTAWAKETALLAVILLFLEAWRGRAPWVVWLCTLAAFLVPTAILRTMYPAPLGEWAWWGTIFQNVPFLVWTRPMLSWSLRNNLKVLLFLNVFWILGALGWRRNRDPFLQSLATTLLCYVGLAWTVVYIRELRHSLPFVVLVLPLGVAEIQRLVTGRAISEEDGPPAARS